MNMNEQVSSLMESQFQECRYERAYSKFTILLPHRLTLSRTSGARTLYLHRGVPVDVWNLDLPAPGKTIPT